MNVEPNPPAGGFLEAKHYIETEASSPLEPSDKYGVIVKDSYQQTYESRHGNDYSTVDYQKLIEFDTKEGLQKWVIDNKESYSPKAVIKYIRFNELKATLKVEVELA